MKRIMFALPTLLLVLALALPYPAFAASEPGYTRISDEAGAEYFTPEELEDLVAPIALYPDPLIAQILPAATFVDQLREAAEFVRRYGNTQRIDDQPWDVSVRAVAHYPDVLYMMDEKFDWTASLGQAFLDQQQEVMDAIQRLRAEARARGNLYSTQEQQVIYDEDVVRIVPASPEYVYVPVYDPQVVYVERYDPSYPLVTFGMGFGIGAWLSRDCDWRGRRVYYHGWRRDGGWIGRARPYVRDRRGVYINRRASVVYVNERVRQHDSRRFREELRSEVGRRRETRGITTITPGTVQPRGTSTEQRSPVTVIQPGVSRGEQRVPGTVRQGGSRSERAPGRVERRGPSRIIRPGAGVTTTRPAPAVPPPAAPAIRLPAPSAVPPPAAPAIRLPAPSAVPPPSAPVPPLATGTSANPAANPAVVPQTRPAREMRERPSRSGGSSSERSGDGSGSDRSGGSPSERSGGSGRSHMPRR